MVWWHGLSHSKTSGSWGPSTWDASVTSWESHCGTCKGMLTSWRWLENCQLINSWGRNACSGLVMWRECKMNAPRSNSWSADQKGRRDHKGEPPWDGSTSSAETYPSWPTGRRWWRTVPHGEPLSTTPNLPPCDSILFLDPAQHPQWIRSKEEEVCVCVCLS